MKTEKWVAYCDDVRFEALTLKELGEKLREVWEAKGKGEQYFKLYVEVEDSSTRGEV